MVDLVESIEIPASFERLCEWVDNFEEEFVKWSPYHLECNLIDGGINAGDRLRFYEIVMGMDYDVTGTITFAQRDRNRFCFTFFSDAKTASITFEGKRTENGCKFTHTESFGISTPVIGPILNFIFFKVIYRKKADWNIIRQDMKLDNIYLKDILTEGKYPDRIPLSELKKQ